MTAPRGTLEHVSDNAPKPHPRMPAITRDPVTGEHRAVEEPVTADRPPPDPDGPDEGQ